MQRINYTIDENNFITEWHIIPFDASKPYIEVADGVHIVLGLDKVVDGIFVPDVERQNAIQQIDYLKRQLAATDYEAIKFAEGRLTAEEFAPISDQRQSWRDEINALEAILKTE